MRNQVFETVLAGVLTFVAGQTLLKLVVDPVQAFKTTVAAIANSLIRYGNRLGNPGTFPAEEAHEIRAHFRGLSSQLTASSYLVPGYSLTSWIFWLPSRRAVHEAAANLIGISNMLLDPSSATESAYLQTETCDLLGIFVHPANRATRRARAPAA